MAEAWQLDATDTARLIRLSAREAVQSALARLQAVNPWDRTRTGRVLPRGGGGGAIAVGNDIAGSIRWPAFCNGVVGLRPSLGQGGGDEPLAAGGANPLGAAEP
jgi:hypothetical protein